MAPILSYRWVLTKPLKTGKNQSCLQFFCTFIPWRSALVVSGSAIQGVLLLNSKLKNYQVFFPEIRFQLLRSESQNFPRRVIFMRKFCDSLRNSWNRISGKKYSSLISVYLKRFITRLNFCHFDLVHLSGVGCVICYNNQGLFTARSEDGLIMVKIEFGHKP